MNKVFNKTTGLLCILTVMIYLVVLINPFDISGQVSETTNFQGHSQHLTYEELFNATNTFNLSHFNIPARQMGYNMSVRNGNLVASIPQITVLTHGVGGTAGDWSNHGDADFARTHDSLHRRLYTEAGGADIYWAIMQEDSHDFLLVDVTNQSGIYNRNLNNKQFITEASRHIIIIFQADNPDGFNDDIYWQFNFMLSRIKYDIKLLNNGRIPMVNLVGHSRGGLTNLRYTLDHPDLVHSMVSVGTPFFGSTTGTLYTSVPIIGGDKDAYYDIMNADRQRNYNNRWNNDFNRLYSNINAVSIGGYSSIEFFHNIIYNHLGLAASIAAAPFIHGIASNIAIGFSSPAASFLSYLLEMLWPGSIAAAYAHLIIDCIRIDWPRSPTWIPPFVQISVFNDVLVHLGSQLAESGSISGASDYLGFTRLTRYFDFNDGTDFSKVAQPNVPVVHNLITRDNQILDMIVEQIGLGTFSIFDTRIISGANNIELSVRQGVVLEGIIRVPYVIRVNGVLHNVTQIATDGFANQTKIEEVVLPSSITRISDRAFENSGLKIVTIPENSNLIEIGNSAFRNNHNLSSIHLPRSLVTIGNSAFESSNLNTVTISPDSRLTDIGDNAFRFNRNLTDIHLPRSLRIIGNQAFEGCINLQSVTFESQSLLSVIGNNAFRDCWNLTDFIIPMWVTEIGQDAFQHANLRTITIPATVMFVGDRAFRNNPNLREAIIVRPSDVLFNGTTAGGLLIFDRTHPELTIRLPNDTSLIAYSNAFGWRNHADRMWSHTRPIHLELNQTRNITGDLISGSREFSFYNNTPRFVRITITGAMLWDRQIVIRNRNRHQIEALDGMGLAESSQFSSEVTVFLSVSGIFFIDTNNLGGTQILLRIEEVQRHEVDFSLGAPLRLNIFRGAYGSEMHRVILNQNARFNVSIPNTSGLIFIIYRFEGTWFDFGNSHWFFNGGTRVVDLPAGTYYIGYFQGPRGWSGNINMTRVNMPRGISPDNGLNNNAVTDEDFEILNIIFSKRFGEQEYVLESYN